MRLLKLKLAIRRLWLIYSTRIAIDFERWLKPKLKNKA